MKDDLTLRVPLGRVPMTHTQHDANFKRLMYWSGLWAAGTYEANECVQHRTGTWVVKPTVATTTQEPLISNILSQSSDWDVIALSPWGFGEMTLTSPNAGFPDLGAGWTPVTYSTSGFDQNTTLNPAQGTVSFDREGTWELQFSFSIDHVQENSGRITNMRAFNVTESIGGSSTPIGIGRNVEVTNGTATVWLVVATDDVGDLFRVELGGGDTVVVNEMTTARLAVKMLV